MCCRSIIGDCNKRSIVHCSNDMKQCMRCLRQQEWESSVLAPQGLDMMAFQEDADVADKQGNHTHDGPIVLTK